VHFTRREIGKLGLAALPGAALLGRADWVWGQAKPNSKVRGVQIGLNVPYNYGSNNMPGDEVLQRTLQLGVSGVELRSQPVEAFIGVPAAVRGPARGQTATPEQEAERKANAAAIQKARLSAPMSKVTEFRKKWNDAGVAIEIVKFDGIFGFTDDVTDYAFELAKNLGARAISCEISTPVSDTKRLGQFADKHKIMVGYHGHTKTGPEHWEEAFGYSRHNGANVDIGHFIAGFNTSPVAFLKKHHGRITHIHVKDRKMNEGANTPFGQGDTPIKEVLQLIRDNKWNIQATIEFEYPVPEGSDRMAEMAKCVQYCREALS
jgi:sugar phosphate isomerase/epimerase